MQNEGVGVPLHVFREQWSKKNQISAMLVVRMVRLAAVHQTLQYHWYNTILSVHVLLVIEENCNNL